MCLCVCVSVLACVYLFACAVCACVDMFKDIGRLMVWVLREYNEVDPIILSGKSFSIVPLLVCFSGECPCLCLTLVGVVLKVEDFS